MKWNEKSQTPEMFNRIAAQYDRMNTVLSFGFHHAWRRRLVAQIPQSAKSLLDVACGTGDQLIAAMQNRPLEMALGVDPSRGMLAIAKTKVAKSYANKSIQLELGTAEQLPAENNTFDVVTMSFGIRNVTDVSAALQEMHRVLKPHGTVLIMEFSAPPNVLLRIASRLYLQFIVPLIGRAFARDIDAYGYLAESIKHFPSGEAFCALLRNAKFNECKITRLFFGNVTIYSATK